MNKFQQERYDMALNYASRGWRVLPVSMGKTIRPVLNDWAEQATTDTETITKWFTEYENCNLGIATGKESGIFVLDIDIKNGKNGMKSLMDEYGEETVFNTINKKARVKTCTGGLHVFFDIGDLEIGNRANVLPGIDIRGDGGCVYAAPSSRLMEDGWKRYVWADLENGFATVDDWVLDLLTRESTAGKMTTDDFGQLISGVESGSRDEQLNRFAWSLMSRGYSFDIALAFVLTAAEKCNPPFEQDVAREKVERAYTTGVERAPEIKKAKSMEEIIAEAKIINRRKKT